MIGIVYMEPTIQLIDRINPSVIGDLVKVAEVKETKGGVRYLLITEHD